MGASGVSYYIVVLVCMIPVCSLYVELTRILSVTKLNYKKCRKKIKLVLYHPSINSFIYFLILPQLIVHFRSECLDKEHKKIKMI